MALEVRAASDAAELQALAPIIAWAFGGVAEDSLKWLSKGGVEQVRVGFRGGRLAAGLLTIPMGHWFGERSVPAVGIAGVAIAPEFRGEGNALSLMRETLRDARDRGVALSSLYPASLQLYRKAGYEIAGTRCRWTLDLKACPRPSSDLELDRVGPSEHSELERVYTRVARTRPAYLDRGPYIWERVRSSGTEEARLVAVRGATGIEAYAALLPRRSAGVSHDLSLTDFVAESPGAFDRLLRFLSDHRSTVKQVTWYGGPVDARLFGFPEHAFKVEVDNYWMLRLVDVQRALTSRGYPPVSGELDLQVDDDVLEANSRRFQVRLRDGVPDVQVTRSGGAVRVHVRTLAALYSGFADPLELVRAGRLEADARALATLRAFFAGAPPAMPDYF